MKKTFKKIALVAMLLLLVVTPVFASTANEAVVSGENVVYDKEYDGSVFVTGENVDAKGSANGIVFASGNKLNIDSKCEYVIAAGYDVALGGNVEKDVIIGAYSIDIQGSVGRDIYAAAKNIAINGAVNRNVNVAAKTIEINGVIKGDVYINAENIIVGKDAKIEGNLTYNDDASLSMANTNVTGKTETYKNESTGQMNYTEPTFASKALGKLTSYLGLVVLSFVLLWLSGIWETLDKKYTGKDFGKFATAFGIGVAVLFGVPLVSLILMLSGIGLRLAGVIICLYIALIMAAPIFASFFVGSLIWRNLMKKPLNYFAELPIGILVYIVLSMIPFISFLVNFAAIGFGIGAVVLLLGKNKADPMSAIPVEGERAKIQEY